MLSKYMIGKLYIHNTRKTLYRIIGEVFSYHQLDDDMLAYYVVYDKNHGLEQTLCDKDILLSLDNVTFSLPVTIQNSNNKKNEVFLIYQDDNKRVWARPTTEFLDGRFTIVG